ncbi:MAG: hypothetical protein EB127_10100, partial [Alphaproteobacteria bacterium]|nr:hypothetical protein [Alphaproteobacteria bacterium]
MKRKQTSELRTNPVALTVGRTPAKSDLWDVTKLQPFFPPIECLFKTNSLERVQDYGIKLNDGLVSVTEGVATLASGRTIEVHPKITMLLSPYKCMKGEFGTFGLPMLSEHARETQSKLQSHNTAAYVGSILSIALSQSGCQHFPEVLAVYTGSATKHTIDISDDYEELSDRPWFSQNIGKTFELRLDEHSGTPIEYTRSARLSLQLGEEAELGEVEELVAIHADAIPAEMTRVFRDEEPDDETESTSDVSTSYIFQIESVSSSFDGSVGEGSEDEPFAWATFKNVPVQMTVMEKLEGTLYELLKDSDSEKHFAWIAQIIFALAYAQRNFAFTHNDLHGNNIMFKKTDKEFLYYFHAGITYKVPTYGYLLKIIDFDRGIGSIKLPGMKEAKLFMSDQFAASEEAGGQYNCQPFFTEKHKIIKPNPSFDLVRLATSLFWDLFPNGPKYDDYQTQPLFKLFIKWMTL